MWNVLLYNVDDEQLTDKQGRTVNLTKTVMLFSSNIGLSDVLGVARDLSYSRRLCVKDFERLQNCSCLT